MATGTGDRVLDASVLVKTVLPENLSEAAARLLEPMHGVLPSRILVPGLLYLEIANALRTKVSRGSRNRRDMEAAFAWIHGLALTVVPDRELAPAALRIALDLRITPYDAAYVALSDREDAPLISDDRELLHRLRGTRHRFVWLGELEP